MISEEVGEEKTYTYTKLILFRYRYSTKDCRSPHMKIV